jgi:hypothetical protein
MSVIQRVVRTGCGLLVALAFVSPEAAKAIEVQCIEASKYKYLYQMFDNDRAKFAEFLHVSVSALPDGEICRAGIITGKIEMSKDAREDGRDSDYKTLLSFIERNRGWLSQLYLASGGGNIGMGLGLAEVARMFWLKTRSVEGKSFVYRPDFIPTAPASQQWLKLAELTVTSGNGRCASACTFMHMAGIDRQGTAYVHRGRPGKPGDKSMTEIMGPGSLGGQDPRPLPQDGCGRGGDSPVPGNDHVHRRAGGRGQIPSLCRGPSAQQMRCGRGSAL